MKKVIGEIVLDKKYIVRETVTYVNKGIFKDTHTDKEVVNWSATKDLHERVAKDNNIIPEDSELMFSASRFVHPENVAHIHTAEIPYAVLFKVIKDFPTEEK
jgi:hypothetical protein